MAGVLTPVFRIHQLKSRSVRARTSGGQPDRALSHTPSGRGEKGKTEGEVSATLTVGQRYLFKQMPI